MVFSFLKKLFSKSEEDVVVNEASRSEKEFDVEEASLRIQRIVSSDRTVSEGMKELADYCTEFAPSPVWNQIDGIDFRSDETALCDWLKSILASSPPDDDVIAFYFGLFTAQIDEKSTFQLYVSGADEFDADDETADWACSPVYFPDNRYAPSQVLSQMYDILSKDENAFSVGEYVLCLGYGCLAVRELMKSTEPSLVLGDTDQRFVAVGFDDGDVITLGRVTRNGFQML